MTIWTPRNLAIGGSALAMAGLFLGGSLWADMLAHRAGIQSSAEATCTDPGKDCAQKDLPAQVRAATAAEAMADLTFWQSILGTMGLLVGGATLLAAARAAHWAKDAAHHTKRSADVAETAFASLERPYLFVEIIKSGVVKVGKETTFGPVKYRYVNLGRTPAVITREKFQYRRTETGRLPSALDPLTTEGAQVPYGYAIAPGKGSTPFKTGTALPITSLAAQMQAGDKTGPELFLLGFVKYRSLSGSEYVTGFCFLHAEDSFEIASPRLKPGEDDRYNYDRKLS